MSATNTTIAPAERRARRKRLAAIDVLPVGTELERAMLGRLVAIVTQALEIRKTEGKAAYTRYCGEGICDMFDELAIDVGSDEARAALDWAIHRMWATLCAIRPVRPTDDA